MVPDFVSDHRYVRDLIKYLRSDKYTAFEKGLKAAPNLIRSKASFGTELSSQAYDLASIIIGLQDNYDMDNFQEMRQAALVSLVASAPQETVSCCVNLYFTGDISLQQRCIILSALAIGARELAELEKVVRHPLPKC